MFVDRKLIDFAVNYIAMIVMAEHGLYHDQDSAADDLKTLEDKGMMPSGYYDLKALLDENTH